MHTLRTCALTAFIAFLPALAACGSSQSNAGSGLADSISHSISKAMDKEATRMKSEPITISNGASNLPTAKITPKGDLIVDGKGVATTPSQRTELLQYRKQLLAIATEGMQVGKQGAALGLHAAGTAIAGALSGKSSAQIQQQVEEQTTGIRKAATKLCERLPALMAEQQKLAKAVPAFKPYATMTQKDVDDCRVDASKGEN